MAAALPIWTNRLREILRYHHHGITVQAALQQAIADGAPVTLYSSDRDDDQDEPYLLKPGKSVIVPRCGDLLVGIALKGGGPVRVSVQVGGVEVGRLCLYPGASPVPPVDGSYPLPMLCFDYRLTRVVPLDGEVVELLFVYAAVMDTQDRKQLATSKAWAPLHAWEYVVFENDGASIVSRPPEGDGSLPLPHLTSLSTVLCVS
jgi:hypothetical protein